MSIRSGIVVLGMHRSGTSSVGGVLHAMGAYFGAADTDLGGNAENLKGFWERKDFNWVCEFALLAQAANWAAPPLDGEIGEHAADLLCTAFARLRVELDAHPPWFIKDPRLCVLLPALLPQLGDTAFVHVARDPVEIAQSLTRRNGLTTRHALALWELHTIRAFAASMDRPRCIVDYAALCEDPAAVVAELCLTLNGVGVDGLKMPDAAALSAAIDPALHRERRPEWSTHRLNGAQEELQRAIADRSIFAETQARTLSEEARDELAGYASLRGAAVGPRVASGFSSAGAVARLREQITLKLAGRDLDVLLRAN